MNDKICKKIVLTGGACGGKSESLPFIKEYFSKLGYDVYIVNEMATILILGGITAQKVGGKNFQELVIRMQLEIQKTYEKAISLSENNKNLIIFDRCPIDAMMFINREEFDEIANKFNTTYEDILNSYDGIIHMEAIAKRFPELYTSDNNKARRDEGLHTIETDNRLLEAYKNHHKRIIVNSYKNFNEKINNVIQKIEEII